MVTGLSTNDNTPQLTGTVSDPSATVQVTVNGSTYTATNNGDGTWTLADNTIAPALALLLAAVHGMLGGILLPMLTILTSLTSLVNIFLLSPVSSMSLTSIFMLFF